MRVLQHLKIPCAALPDLLFHLKILHNFILLTLPLLLFKIRNLDKLFSIILHHVVLLQSLFLTLPLLLLKIYQMNKLFSIILHHVFILQSLLLTVLLLFKIHQLHKLFSIILHHVFLHKSHLILPLLFLKIFQRLQRSWMPMWTNPALVFHPQWGNFLLVLKIINTMNRWRTWLLQA
jgi:hypothetical protein